MIVLFSFIIAAFTMVWANTFGLFSRLLSYFNGQDLLASIQTTVFRDTPEKRTPEWFPIKGRVPEWFNGIMYRVGPGKYNIDQADGRVFAINHAFDGMPFMHRFEISSQKQAVRYNSRNISEEFESSIAKDNGQGKIFFGHQPIVSSVKQRLRDIYLRFDRMLLSRVPLDEGGASSQPVGVTATPNFPLPPAYTAADKQNGESNRVLVAKTDANMLQQLDSDTLEPKRLYTYGNLEKKLKGDLSAAHHQYDPITKETINFVLDIFPARLQVFSSTPEGKVTILADFTHRLDEKRTRVQPAYIHAFNITKDYIILPEYSLAYTNMGLDFLIGGAVSTGMAWSTDRPTYFHIVSRHGKGLVASVPVDNFFSFHVANAWDSTDSQGRPVIDMDICAFENADIMCQLHTFANPVRQSEYELHLKKQQEMSKRSQQYNGMNIPPMRQPSFGDLRRYHIVLENGSGEATYKTIAFNLEFARFSQDYAMRKSKFVYGCQMISVTEKSNERYDLLKINTDDGSAIRYSQEGCACSEPIFAPRPGGTREDDGVLMSLVNKLDKEDPSKDECFLLLLDAKTMQEIATCHVGQFTATTFHGSFVDHHFENVSVN
ncbi:carotenoid oxygenase [Phycomyces nitens]|nr:carotenoid oxygenase [Phycomyces nitens]